MAYSFGRTGSGRSGQIEEKKSMKRTALILASLFVLSGCMGRAEPEGSFLDPVCMPDGSVAFRQLPNSKDEYGQPIAKRENCAWNKVAKK
jgi:hypothetical protein